MSKLANKVALVTRRFAWHSVRRSRQRWPRMSQCGHYVCEGCEGGLPLWSSN